MSAGRYLRIERQRFDDQLKLQWGIENLPAASPISQLPPQPLLESRLIYGIQPRIAGGLVQIATNYLNGMFSLCVSSPEGRVEQAAPHGAHPALANIDRRLVALFGAQASLSVERHDGRHCSRLRYPCTSLMQEARAL